MDGSDWILSAFHTSAAANKLKREKKRKEKCGIEIKINKIKK